MGETQFGNLVRHPMIARPVLEAGTEAVGSCVDVGALERPRDGVVGDRVAVAPVEEEIGAVAFARHAHDGNRLTRKRDTVDASHLHVERRHRPDRRGEVELIPGRAADLYLPRRGQYDETDSELGQRRARVDAAQGGADLGEVEGRVVLDCLGAFRQVGHHHRHRVVVRAELPQRGVAEHGRDVGGHGPGRGMLAVQGQWP